MMNHQDEIRRDQIEHARRNTLSARRVSNGNPPNRPNGGKKPFVAKGHDAILKGIQERSGDSTILVTLMGDGAEVRGKLVARDKFTITVLTPDGRRRTFYKHAIEGFEPVFEPTNDDAEQVQ